MLTKKIHHAFASEETAPCSQLEIHIPQEIPPVQIAYPGLQRVEMPAYVKGSHQRTDRGATYDVGFEPCFGKGAYHADVRPATGRAAAEHQADALKRCEDVVGIVMTSV